MSNHKVAHQFPEIGRVAMRMVAIQVMALALLVSYLALRSSLDEPAQIAEVAPALLLASQRIAPSREIADSPAGAREPALRAAAVIAHHDHSSSTWLGNRMEITR